MPFKLSRCINLRHPDREKLVEFYKDVLGFEVAGKVVDAYELKTEPIRFFVDQAKSRELVLELLVPDLEAARDELVAAGCQVVVWGGKGKDCYIRDPFGTTYNLWEDRDAFNE